MPMRKDDDHGTNADGSRNTDYCHLCFKDGKFTDEGITMEQKIENMVSFARGMNISEDNAREMAKNILPGLKRWKTK